MSRGAVVWALALALAPLAAVGSLAGCKKQGASERCPDRPTGHKYLYVDEVDLKSACFAKYEYRVAGRLKPGSHRVRRVGNRMEHRFVLYRRQGELPVTYFGAVPERFRDHLIVIVGGRVENGRFRATSFAFDFNSFSPMYTY